MIVIVIAVAVVQPTGNQIIKIITADVLVSASSDGTARGWQV